MAAKDFTLTAARVRELLDYDPSTGVFTWRVARGRVPAGAVVGRIRQGRIVVGIDKHEFSAHRIAWLHFYGQWPIYEVDHKDGVPLNNSIANLRDVPHAVNQQNRRRADRDNHGGFLGTSRYKNGRYRAQIMVSSKFINLGTFLTGEEAHAAYVEAKRRLHAGCTI